MLTLYDFKCSICKTVEEHFIERNIDGESYPVTGDNPNYPFHCYLPMIKQIGTPMYDRGETWRAVNYRHLTRKENRKPKYFLPKR